MKKVIIAAALLITVASCKKQECCNTHQRTYDLGTGMVTYDTYTQRCDMSHGQTQTVYDTVGAANTLITFTCP